MVPKTIVLISDPRILCIPIRESGDLLTDICETPQLVVDHRKKNDSDSYFLIRQSVLKKLLESSRRLPGGIRFAVVEGYRPLSLQKIYFDQYLYGLRTLHSDWNAARIREETSKFVASPDIIPPHSTGGAVDLTLIDKNGDELDMGTLVNADPEESKNACFTDAQNISDTAKILIQTMSESDFVNYPTEWWHWSYGDRYWAYHSGRAHALFGSVE
jgi:zinc D-Ala-D-Ala dipeptidase